MSFNHHFFPNFQALEPQWPAWRPAGKMVFTNGCFDILHAGHVAYLEEARALGDTLVVGINSDASVSRLKGPKRPLNKLAERAAVLLGLRSVTAVIGFDQDTPYDLIRRVHPDILVKGGDWKIPQIIGSDLVLGWGGRVASLSFKAGVSTTGIVERILHRYGEAPA